MPETEPVMLACQAMATRFELVMFGDKKDHLRAAGQEALLEIERLDAQLSFYRQDSDINDLNVRAAWEDVPVEPRLFRLLSKAVQLSELTGGAFDITVAPLLHCWGLAGGEGRIPDEAELDVVRRLVGWKHLILNDSKYTVRFDKDGVQIDLGSIGKGYAIDCAAEILREHEIECALLHGGTSSVAAIGAPPNQDGWRVSIQNPYNDSVDADENNLLLKDCTLSVSAPHGKSFTITGKKYGHVINPITGRPETHSVLSAISTHFATEGDALSTALLTQGESWLPTLAEILPDCRALLVLEDGEGQVDYKRLRW